MIRCRTAILLLALAIIAGPAVAQAPRATGNRPDRSTSMGSTERWLQQLANDLTHLYEDVLYERGKYPEDLRDRIDETSRAVAHFQHVLSNSNDVRHLRKDFEEMDKLVHDLVKSLNEMDDSWLRRQAARIIYSDEQVHYAVQRRREASNETRGELLTRQAHLLEDEARDFEALAQRIARHDQQLRGSIHDFAEHASHFHRVIEGGADAHHLSEDFQKVDEAWHAVVERINNSTNLSFYLRTAAQNVNRTHNQIHELVNGGHNHSDYVKEQPPDPANTAPPEPAPRRRPAIEFEIPGIGRFQIPQ